MSVTLEQEVKMSPASLLRKSVEENAFAPAAVAYLGMGVDVFAPSPTEGLVHQLAIFDFNKCGTKIVDIDRNLRVELPEIVNMYPTSAYQAHTGSTTSKTATSNQISIGVGVEAGYNMFSAGVNTKFTKSNSKKNFAYYTSHIEKIAMADISLNTRSEEYFSDEFLEDLNALPENAAGDNYENYAQFFRKWGLYFLTYGSLGGDLSAYNAVQSSDVTTTNSCEVNMKAQFNALFYSGGLSTSVTNSESWSVYSEYSTTEFYISGGSPEKQGAVVSVDPLKPSQASVDAHTEWLQSVAIYPSVTNLQFDPIWTLAGSKRDAMKDAADRYVTAVGFHTNLNKDNSPTVWSGLTAVYVNNEYHAPSQMDKPGFQVVIINRNDPNQITNHFFGYDYDTWQASSVKMYNEMYEFLQGYNDQYTVVLAAQNMNTGAYPTAEMQNYLEYTLGVEKALMEWSRHENRTSNNGMQLLNFTVVSSPGVAYNEGAGFFFSAHWRDPMYIVLSTGASVLLNGDGSPTIEKNM